MSNPTTPFSWQMPTNTDLVTDLPADFEVFGQAVATSMQDLLGGTTGQLLSKTSNTDMDFTWTTPASSIPANSSAVVATSQSTTSESFTDLTTAGPAVTVTTGTKALVIIGGELYQGTADRGLYMGFAVSGATTIAANAATSIGMYYGANDQLASKFSGAFVVTLTAGSNTFTAKYCRRGNSGTAAFNDRTIFVMNLV